jgi:hypothetical protein
MIDQEPTPKEIKNHLLERIKKAREIQRRFPQDNIRGQYGQKTQVGAEPDKETFELIRQLTSDSSPE